MPQTITPDPRCQTPGCGHVLPYHHVTENRRCRVSGCGCDEWRAVADPVDESLEGLWKRAREEWHKGSAIVFLPKDVTSLGEAKLAMVRAGLSLGEGPFPVQLFAYVEKEEHDPVG